MGNDAGTVMRSMTRVRRAAARREPGSGDTSGTVRRGNEALGAGQAEGKAKEARKVVG